MASAISLTLSRGIVPTFSTRALPLPFSIPAAFLRSSEAGGALDDKGKRAVFEYGQLYRHDGAGLGGGALVVLFDEAHDIDAVLAQGGADRGRGRRLAGVYLEFDYSPDFLCQVIYPLLGSFDLQEVELNRGFASKEGDQHSHLGPVGVNLIDDAHEVHEGGRL